MVRFHVGGKFYDRRQSLSSLEAQLDPKQFWRIERSYIVNVERIRQINILSENKYEIVLHGGKTLAMSRDYRRRLRDLGWDL
jgi:two-component system LytT family response regulator